MITTSTFEAKAKLSELLARVLAGEEVTITRHRVPVARLVPVVSQQAVKQMETQAS